VELRSRRIPGRRRTAGRRFAGLGLGVALAAGVGCVSAADLIDATLPLPAGSYTEIGETEGTSTGFSLLFFEIGAADSIGEARDEAIRDANADALVRVSADSTDFWFLFLFGVHKTTVRGTAVKHNP
jgi:hypothetical protein